MTKYVALLRGINVGGHRLVKMADLKAVVEGLGYTAVQHYVQSGNLVFEGVGVATEVAATLEAACQKAFGFETEIMVRTEADFCLEVASCPYIGADMAPAAGRDAKFLHLAFLNGTPDAAHIEALLQAYDGPEEISLKGNVLHIYYTEGSGRSKLTPLLSDKKLGVAATARNWNTALKLLAMLE